MRLCACGNEIEQGRAARCNACRFPKSTRIKLTPDDVRTIRREVRFLGDMTPLAARYGVSLSTIQDVTHRRSWRHVK